MPADVLDFVKGEIILIDKHEGISSFDVIRRIKKILPVKKIGHAGTLDPLAQGLLILCTGKETKSIYKYQHMFKVYTGTMKLGAETASYDRDTPVQKTYPWEHIDADMLACCRKNFLGNIDQKPPVYSALKIKGERLYKKALRGESVEIPVRKVSIHEFELTGIQLPEIAFRVTCSKGTYIRSLIHDFGKCLHSGAFLKALRREQIGDYHVDEALTLEAFEKKIRSAQRIVL
jgi:tRNA pseudouridine55 synthase